MKYIALTIYLSILFQLSGTSSLEVLSISTWFNATEYDPNVSAKDFFQWSSDFYQTSYPPLAYASANFFAHKLAHLTFYGTLALLFLWVFTPSESRYVYAFFATAFAGFLEEAHQYFVVGRTGMVYDVYLNATGAFLFLTVFAIFSFLWKRTRKKETLLDF